MSLVRREKSFVAKNALIDPHVNLCRLAASATIFCTKILSRAVAERVSWQEAFYGFCMSLNVAFLALVYHPAAEEAFSKSKKLSLSLAIGSLFTPALLLLNVQVMEKLWKSAEMQT